jgi:hypothetical protein
MIITCGLGGVIGVTPFSRNEIRKISRKYMGKYII